MKAAPANAESLFMTVPFNVDGNVWREKERLRLPEVP
jgi:hypothetical protein